MQDDGFYDFRIHPPEESLAYVKAVAAGGHVHLFARDLIGVSACPRQGMFERVILRRPLKAGERVVPMCGDPNCVRPEHMVLAT